MEIRGTLVVSDPPHFIALPGNYTVPVDEVYKAWIDHASDKWKYLWVGMATFDQATGIIYPDNDYYDFIKPE